MKHIARVLIENFQSHIRSDLALSGGLNVIIGPSDNGKSAVLRAIRWALYNEPRGTEFVRNGARECRVTVTMSDGAEIIREMLLTKSGTPSRNRYLVQIPGTELQVFEGFGAEVPAEVLRAHGMSEVQLDTDKRVLLSFGTQLEGPFLMTETGSVRARAIGRLLGVHVVDAAIRNTQRDMRSLRTEVTRLEREVERYETELLPFADIPEQEARLDLAGQKLVQAELATRRLTRLQEIRQALAQADREEIITSARLGELADIEAAEQHLRRAEEIHRQVARLERLDRERSRIGEEERRAKGVTAVLAHLPVAEERLQRAVRGEERLSGLRRLATELGRRTAELADAERRLGGLGQINRADQFVGEASAKLQRLQRLRQQLEPLQEVKQRLARGHELLRQTESELGEHLAQFEGALRQLGRCPTCMQSVEPTAIKRILAELAQDPAATHSPE